MNSERLCQLAKQYPEIQELLRDNHSLSIAVLAARLEERDRGHIEAQKLLEKRVAALESHNEVLDKALTAARQEYAKLRVQVEKQKT